ncbi:Lrp/AsnC family transcriptional regulator, regulator of ectoine-degradation genes [Cohaesibacter marisflavi]|uniref:Lrp/AsnC family transcriptional regulator, regulator of ectoine-degradation genes n=1 Tax=Cohaesibacter marisflavi TaxID=655353 RepID=A0A1I4ZVA5_9HYPH|nr:Lrp/AsnC family transcriptional regulator [Cohaesibacter marisflavi]SFN54128.1 Lrp/AsnC family transcriptional regulator, regulator of ectoine-degradation genes [Cohaesibacter marisflavi]
MPAAGLKLDDRDWAILKILQTEGRITKAALAQRVNLSPTPCWERLKRLEEAGIIEAYETRLSLKAFGALAVVFVEVELDSHRSEDFERFETAVQDYPEILECWAVGGGLDYILKIVAKDVDHYQRLIDHMLEADIGLRRYFTYVVTKPVVNRSALPLEKLQLG